MDHRLRLALRIEWGMQPSLPLQQFVDRHLAKAGIGYRPSLVLNYLHTQIAMVEAGQGIAIVPSYTLPECRNRGLGIHPLLKPTVHLDLYQIRNGGFAAVAAQFTD